MINNTINHVLTNIHKGLDKTPLVAFSAMGMALVYHTANGTLKPNYNVNDITRSTMYVSMVTILAQTLSKGVEKVKNAYFSPTKTVLDNLKTFTSKNFAIACLGGAVASIAGIGYINYKNSEYK